MLLKHCLQLHGQTVYHEMWIAVQKGWNRRGTELSEGSIAISYIQRLHIMILQTMTQGLMNNCFHMLSCYKVSLGKYKSVLDQVYYHIRQRRLVPSFASPLWLWFWLGLGLGLDLGRLLVIRPELVSYWTYPNTYIDYIQGVFLNVPP